jgi:hypothetical protein
MPVLEHGVTVRDGYFYLSTPVCMSLLYTSPLPYIRD